jgi:hypothetical protein
MLGMFGEESLSMGERVSFVRSVREVAHHTLSIVSPHDLVNRPSWPSHIASMPSRQIIFKLRRYPGGQGAQERAFARPAG